MGIKKKRKKEEEQDHIPNYKLRNGNYYNIDLQQYNYSA